MQWRMLRLLTGLAVLTAGLPGRAEAGEWRYCLATSAARHAIYMSAAFPTDQPMETIESAFGSALDRASLPHDSVQCPRSGDAQSIAAMKLQAIQYSQASGNKVIQLNWRP